MPTKTTNKVSPEVKRSMIPEVVDTSALIYLQKGDVTRVAASIGESAQYVSRVKLGKNYNVKILSALIKKGLDNKKKLTQAK